MSAADKICLVKSINMRKLFLTSEPRHDKTPKCFLWHTSDDGGVNVKNSLVFAEQLRDHGIQFEMHIYPHGAHGSVSPRVLRTSANGQIRLPIGLSAIYNKYNCA